MNYIRVILTLPLNYGNCQINLESGSYAERPQPQNSSNFNHIISSSNCKRKSLSPRHCSRLGFITRGRREMSLFVCLILGYFHLGIGYIVSDWETPGKLCFVIYTLLRNSFILTLCVLKTHSFKTFRSIVNIAM